jgi:exopolysaccharide production protein ExoZ
VEAAQVTGFSRTDTICSIQVLRFIAAFAVVVLHASTRTEWLHSGHDDPVGFLKGGVDIFFVISGFVMAYTIKPSTRPLVFAARRLARVAPLYWIAICITVIIGILAPQYSITGAASLPWAAQSMAFATLQKPLFSVGWTLEYEVLFYSMLALCLFLFKRLWASGLVVIMVASLVIAVSLSHVSEIFAWYSDKVIMLEFLFGVAIYHAYKRINLPPTIGLGIAVAGLAIFPAVNHFQGEFLRGITWGLPATLVVLGFLIAEPLFQKPWTRPLLFLGAASYSIYIFHFLVLNKLNFFLSKNPSVLNFESPILLWAFLTAVALGSGLCAYLFLEKPLSRILRKLSAPLAKPSSRCTAPHPWTGLLAFFQAASLRAGRAPLID